MHRLITDMPLKISAAIQHASDSNWPTCDGRFSQLPAPNRQVMVWS